MSAISGLGAGAGLHEIMALRQQIIDRNQTLQNVHAPETGAAQATSDAPSGSFGGALKAALDNVNHTQTQAEALTNAYESGQVTDVAQVMLARQQSGVAFEATLQVRNKLLSAYQDIMKLGV